MGKYEYSTNRCARGICTTFTFDISVSGMLTTCSPRAGIHGFVGTARPLTRRVARRIVPGVALLEIPQHLPRPRLLDLNIAIYAHDIILLCVGPTDQGKAGWDAL